MINKIAEDFEKIVVVTKSKELKRCSKMFYQNRKNEKTTMKKKTRKNWENTGNNILFWV